MKKNLNIFLISMILVAFLGCFQYQVMGAYVWDEYAGAKNLNGLSDSDLGAAIVKLLAVDVDELSKEEIDNAITFTNQLLEHPHIENLEVMKGEEIKYNRNNL